MGIENPVHLLFIAVVALLVLGPKRLPDLARAVGKGVREFREAMSTGEAERTPLPAPPPQAPAPEQAPALPSPAARPPAEQPPAEPPAAAG